MSYFNIMIQGERIKNLGNEKYERVSYKRMVSASNLEELEDRLNEIPEVCMIRESKGINNIERITAIKVA